MTTEVENNVQTTPQVAQKQTPQVPPAPPSDTVNPFSAPPEENPLAAETSTEGQMTPREPESPSPTSETTPPSTDMGEQDQKVGLFKRIAQTLFGTEEVSEEVLQQAEELKARAARDREIEAQIRAEEEAKRAQDVNYQREQQLAEVYKQVYEQTKDPYQAQARVDLIRQQMFAQDFEGVIQQRIDEALRARNAQAGLMSRRPELAPLSNVIADLGRTYGSRLPPEMQPRSPEEQVQLGERFVMELVSAVTGGKQALQTPAAPRTGASNLRPQPSAWSLAQTETGGAPTGEGFSDEELEKMAVEMAHANFGGF